MRRLRVMALVLTPVLVLGCKGKKAFEAPDRGEHEIVIARRERHTGVGRIGQH